jgi:hypothetical protein
VKLNSAQLNGRFNRRRNNNNNGNGNNGWRNG